MIEISNICKSFGNKRVLNNFSLKIEDKCIVGIYGKNGCGKSTLSRILSGSLKPDEGKIFINNSEVVSKDIYKYVQMVYQQPFASFDPVKRIKSGIKEIIKYYNLVPKKEINSYIVYLLQNMELDKKILNHFPHQISGGEAQRIAILKCLLLKPQLLILDESTSMLDVTTQANILSHIKSQIISYGGSIMIISHDYKLLEAYCNKIYNIEEHI